jgi:hypothetical protein
VSCRKGWSASPRRRSSTVSQERPRPSRRECGGGCPSEIHMHPAARRYGPQLIARPRSRRQAGRRPRRRPPHRRRWQYNSATGKPSSRR